MPAPYPQEFRDDVVRVAQNREPGTHLKQIAKDFGISFSCLTNWMRPPEGKAYREGGDYLSKFAWPISVWDQRTSMRGSPLRRTASVVTRSSSPRHCSMASRSEDRSNGCR